MEDDAVLVLDDLMGRSSVVEAGLALETHVDLAPDADHATDDAVAVTLLTFRDGHEILDLCDPVGVRNRVISTFVSGR